MKHILVVGHDLKIFDAVKETLVHHYEVSFYQQDIISMEDLIRIRPDVFLFVDEDQNQEIIDLLYSIRNNTSLKEVPVIIISKQEGVRGKVSKLLEAGADDVVPDTIINELILHRIELCLELKDYRMDRSNAEKFQDAISVSFAELVEFRDETTGGHIKNTTRYFNILLEETIRSDKYKDCIPEEEVRDLLRSAPLHDIGKIGINDDILRKASVLDDHEFEYMKTHTTLGKQAFDKIIRETGGTRWLYLARDIAYCHHERWDGTGYPNGLKGEEIPLYARILTIADVYDALTSRRSYKEAYSHERAMEIIIEGKGSMFDPYLVDIFVMANERFKQALLEKNNKNCNQ